MCEICTDPTNAKVMNLRIVDNLERIAGLYKRLALANTNATEKLMPHTEEFSKELRKLSGIIRNMIIELTEILPINTEYASTGITKLNGRKSHKTI